MRPPKTRRIQCEPGERCFRPRCKGTGELQGVIVTVDEYEALRLSHLEKKEQGEIARMMGIHASTVCRMLARAHEKITDALVNLKAIKVKGGCCKVVPPRKNEK